MRTIIALVMTAMLVAACATPSRMPPLVDAKRVLILSPQGVDPAKDTVGFNTLVKNLTQAFSVEFSDQLTQRGFHSVNVLDQKPGLDTGQKMAVYSVQHQAAKVAIPTVEAKSVDGDAQIQLRVQFIQGDFIVTDGDKVTGLRARTAIDKSYVLRSLSGDTTLSMADIAGDFADFIQGAGRLTGE